MIAAGNEIRFLKTTSDITPRSGIGPLR